MAEPLETTEPPAITSLLHRGWNLGNALDAHAVGFESDSLYEYETLWGNPVITQELFGEIKAMGFSSVRIPVTWGPHINDNYEVAEAKMQRVQEVVDMALAADLAVVLNTHHESWIDLSGTTDTALFEKFEALWKQIATAFADYDERLLFEGLNEPRLYGSDLEWTVGTPEARAAVNTLNQLFVDTVRDAGGHNQNRYLLVTTYCSNTQIDSLADFVMPSDDRVAVSIHLYIPFEFTYEENSRVIWTSQSTTDTYGINQAFDAIDTYLLSKGIPVVLTELGASDKDNDSSRIAWTEYVLSQAAEKNICCIWWDNGHAKDDSLLYTYALIDRYSLEWQHPEIISLLTSK